MVYLVVGVLTLFMFIIVVLVIIKYKKRKHSARELIVYANEYSGVGEMDLERSHSHSPSQITTIPLSKLVSSSGTVNLSSEQQKENLKPELDSPV